MVFLFGINFKICWRESIKIIDSETVDKKLTEFFMQQTKDTLEKLKVQDDSRLKLYSCFFLALKITFQTIWN